MPCAPCAADWPCWPRAACSARRCCSVIAIAGFDVRVGIHTGAVLLGGGVDGDASIRGIAVNIAARMEQTAPTGGCASATTPALQVRGAFDVEPQAPIAVKGVDAPVVTYLVQRARPRTFRTHRARHRGRGHAHGRPRRRACQRCRRRLRT